MSKSVLAPLCVVVVVTVLPTVLRAQDVSAETEGRRRARDLFQDMARNWRRLENYDYLMVMEDHRQGIGSSEFRAFKYRHRMVADHRGERYLFVEGSDGNSQEKNYAAYYLRCDAFRLDTEIVEAWQRRSVDEPAMPLAITRPQGLPASRFPDVRLVGTLIFPSQFSKTPIDQFLVQGVDSADDVKIETTADDRLEVVETHLLGKSSRLQRRFTFAQGKPVPTHLVEINSARDGTQQWVRNDQSIKWEKLNGVLLPSKIHGISRSNREAEPKRYTATFKWLVVNDSNRLPRFDVDTLSNDNRLWEMVSED